MCHAPGSRPKKFKASKPPNEAHKNTLKVFTFDSEKLYISVQIKSKSKASQSMGGHRGADSVEEMLENKTSIRSRKQIRDL